MKKLSGTSLVLVLWLIVSCLFGKTIFPNIIVEQNKKESVFDFSKNKNIKSVKIEASGKDYMAYKLTDIVQNVRGNRAFESVDMISSDGGHQLISKKDLSGAYLAIEKKSGNTYYRLVIPEDAFHQRWIKYVERIRFQ